MLNQTRALAVAGMIVLGSLALACEENGSYSSRPNSGNANKPAGSQVTESDRDFAIKAAMGGKHEVELGRLAADRASDSDVKAFANRMIQDHSRAGDELTQTSSRLGIKAPDEDDTSFKQMVDRLSKLKGVEFDRAYMSDMVEDHMKDLSEIESYAKGDNNPELKAWAAKTVPIVREHLQQAQSIAAKIGAQKK
jgi:putative membrane protein